MSTKTKREYTCDACNTSVIAGRAPSGWMGVRKQGSYGMASNDILLLFGPGAGGKTRRRDIPKESWWCSPPCFKKWLLAQWESANREDIR